MTVSDIFIMSYMGLSTRELKSNSLKTDIGSGFHEFHKGKGYAHCTAGQDLTHCPGHFHAAQHSARIRSKPCGGKMVFGSGSRCASDPDQGPVWRAPMSCCVCTGEVGRGGGWSLEVSRWCVGVCGWVYVGCAWGYMWGVGCVCVL